MSQAAAYSIATFRLLETSGALAPPDTIRRAAGDAVTHCIEVVAQEFGHRYNGSVTVQGGAEAAAAALEENRNLRRTGHGPIVLGAALYERV